MAVFLNDHGKPEPSLLEAVKIVIKYEIQSLLTKLADTGEEYLVLTVSTSDNSCGHIGSAKGEGFVKNSSLELIKEQFLHFCSEEPKQLKSAQPTQNNSPLPIASKTDIAQSSRTHRRKSTPRCKSQPPEWQTQQEIQEIQNYAMTDHPDIDPTINYTNDIESGEALDLSEKQVGGYSYTLDCSSDSYGSNVQSSSSDISKYQSKEGSPAPKYNGFHEEPMAYTWKEEIIPIDFNENKKPKLEYSSDIPLKYDMFLENCKLENNFIDEQEEPMSKGIGKKINNHLQDSRDKNMKPEEQRNKRKPRKAPIKRKKFEEPLSSDAANGPINDSVAEVDNNVIRSIMNGKPTHITDMKSAFLEIGNMAKCLICFKVLANKNNRTFHWRSHVGDKRYQCDICNKAFTHPSNMRSHRKIHTDEKPFPCELCDRRFRRRDYLLQHLERFHYSARPTESLLMDNNNIEGTGDIKIEGSSMVPSPVE